MQLLLCLSWPSSPFSACFKESQPKHYCYYLNYITSFSHVTVTRTMISKNMPFFSSGKGEKPMDSEKPCKMSYLLMNPLWFPHSNLRQRLKKKNYTFAIHLSTSVKVIWQHLCERPDGGRILWRVFFSFPPVDCFIPVDNWCRREIHSIGCFL